MAFVLLAHATHASASPLFDDDSVINIKLIGPFGTLIDANDENVELPFILQANGVEHSIDVRVRGKSRRRVCDFPPLRLIFPDSDTAQTIFAGQDKLKLVTHCFDRESAQADILQEYAAYRIFNIISDVGYRVRLLNITYTDTDSHPDEGTFARYGVVIESAAELARRVDGTAVDVTGVSLATLDDRQEAAVYVFQYLIGNTDWSLVTADDDDTCCHNGDLIDIGDARYYVPYDFDLSGLVNTRYARPDPSLRISRVTQRLYRGFCVNSDALQDAIVAVRDQKSAIFDEVRRTPGLSDKETQATLKYIERFFKQAENEEKMLRYFEQRCL